MKIFIKSWFFNVIFIPFFTTFGSSIIFEGPKLFVALGLILNSCLSLVHDRFYPSFIVLHLWMLGMSGSSKAPVRDIACIEGKGKMKKTAHVQARKIFSWSGLLLSLYITSMYKIREGIISVEIWKPDLLDVIVQESAALSSVFLILCWVIAPISDSSSFFPFSYARICFHYTFTIKLISLCKWLEWEPNLADAIDRTFQVERLYFYLFCPGWGVLKVSSQITSGITLDKLDVHDLSSFFFQGTKRAGHEYHGKKFQIHDSVPDLLHINF